jgi:uncharacterized protein YuzE
MTKFDFDYDENNDSLFIYKKGSVSKNSIELGNFVYDYDASGQIVGIEVLSAIETFSYISGQKIFAKLLENIKTVNVEIKQVKNLIMIKIIILYTVGAASKEIISSAQVPSIGIKSQAIC